MESKESYFEKLKLKMDEYVHSVYTLTKDFPKEELYGVTSQIRRAALSVVLNYIEGYARLRDKVQKNFFEMAYGSLQESKYLVEFSFKEGYMQESEYKKSIQMADEIGAMLWSTIKMITVN